MQRVGDHGGVLVELLLHEVPVARLAGPGPGCGGDLDGALHGGAGRVEEACAAARDHGPVAVAQIGHAARQRGQGQRVRAEEHLVLPIADREGGAELGADHQLGMAREHHRQGIGAVQPAQRGGGGGLRIEATTQMPVDQLGHGLGVGLGW